MFLRCFNIVFGLAICSCFAQPLWAQRYLSEFVGTSALNSATSTANLSARLEFDVQFNRVVDGTFSLGDTLSAANDNFNALGFLLPQDKCNVILQKSGTAGGLRFIEIPFDANSFALIGRVNVTYTRSSAVLRAGRYNGSAAVVQPVADGVPILPENLAQVGAISDLTGARATHSFDITRQYSSRAVDGTLSGAGLLSGFKLTISASPRWTYIVGHNDNRFLAMRVASLVNADNELDEFAGDYAMFDERGQLIDLGAIVGD